MSSPTEEHDLTPMWFLAQPGGSPSGPMPWLELLDRVRASGGAGTWMACPAGGTEWKALSSDPALVASLAPARFDHGIDPMRASAVPPAPIDPNAADHNFSSFFTLASLRGSSFRSRGSRCRLCCGRLISRSQEWPRMAKRLRTGSSSPSQSSSSAQLSSS